MGSLGVILKSFYTRDSPGELVFVVWILYRYNIKKLSKNPIVLNSRVSVRTHEMLTPQYFAPFLMSSARLLKSPRNNDQHTGIPSTKTAGLYTTFHYNKSEHLLDKSILDKKHTGGGKTNKITGIVAIADNEKFIKDYYTKVISEERRNQFKTEQNSQWPKME